MNPETNQVVLGSLDELTRDATLVTRLALSRHATLEGRGLVPATIKVRYNDAGTPGWLEQTGPDELLVYFERGVSAITPGQAAVFYDGAAVLGGGWIARAWNQPEDDVASHFTALPVLNHL